MEFNSQICTSREQSKRLLALGLKAETADCCWIYSFGAETWILFADSYNYLKENDFMREEKWYIPAWSLHRLIEMAQLPQSWQCLSGDWYNEVIAHIQSMLHINQFNKEYLEE